MLPLLDKIKLDKVDDSIILQGQVSKSDVKEFISFILSNTDELYTMWARDFTKDDRLKTVLILESLSGKIPEVDKDTKKVCGDVLKIIRVLLSSFSDKFFFLYKLSKATSSKTEDILEEFLGTRLSEDEVKDLISNSIYLLKVLEVAEKHPSIGGNICLN